MVQECNLHKHGLKVWEQEFHLQICLHSILIDRFQTQGTNQKVRRQIKCEPAVLSRKSTFVRWLHVNLCRCQWRKSLCPLARKSNMAPCCMFHSALHQGRGRENPLPQRVLLTLLNLQTTPGWVKGTHRHTGRMRAVITCSYIHQCGKRSCSFAKGAWTRV